MKHIALNVQAISPLAIRSDHAPGGAETTKYISGTALAGSLAAIHRLYHPDDRENFERLFLKGWVQYPDLYPATFGGIRAGRQTSCFRSIHCPKPLSPVSVFRDFVICLPTKK